MGKNSGKNLKKSDMISTCDTEHFCMGFKQFWKKNFFTFFEYYEKYGKKVNRGATKISMGPLKVDGTTKILMGPLKVDGTTKGWWDH